MAKTPKPNGKQMQVEHDLLKERLAQIAMQLDSAFNDKGQALIDQFDIDELEAERADLDQKVETLAAQIADAGIPDEHDEEGRELMRAQHAYMTNYLLVLEQRIALLNL